MDIITFSEQLQIRMKEQLVELNADQDELSKIGHALAFIREIIAELKQFTSTYKFVSEREEINFFKEIKPVFLSQFFYYKKIFSIRLFDSYKDQKNKEDNYFRLLGQMEKFVQKNLEFYEYFMTNKTHMDKHYFTRSKHSLKSLDIDEKFSTGYDTKLAKILANELLMKYVLRLLQKSQVNHSTSNSQHLTWTGSKADLTELIYALHCVEVFNNGRADIKLIATALESSFNISLGNFYRTFQDIQARKNSQTNFIEQMRAKLLHRIKELD